MRARRLRFVPTLALLLLASCGASAPRLQERLETILRRDQGEDLFNSLLALDQEYPRHPAAKIQLGRLFLAAGDLPKASLYLSRALKLLGRRGTPPLRSQLLADLAECALRSGRCAEGASYADRAQRVKGGDAPRAVFVKAQCLLALGNKTEALEAFRSGWNGPRQHMSREDLTAYSELLLGQEQYAEALEAFAHFERQFGFEASLGIREAAVLQALGYGADALLALFKELEYQRYAGRLSLEEELARLQLLAPMDEALAQGLSFYLQKNWAEAIRTLSPIPLQHELSFRSYLVLSSRLESGGISRPDLEAYLALEPSFRGLPAYYLHLWRGMKRGRGVYDLATARPVLEKCILLAPMTSYSLEARAELGRLLGLPITEGQKILLGPEVELLIRQVQAGAPAENLEPVLRLLETPENIYELAALLLLRQAGRDPAIRGYLETRRKNADGRLGERLNAILSPP